ncbi:MAG: hypothetical protein MJY94_01240 [Bacteroidales bacterium]|nr:hypothetical protein [Bacteroidales bacterium]
MRIIAGIVLYNPEVERLNENVAAILPQVNELLILAASVAVQIDFGV